MNELDLDPWQAKTIYTNNGELELGDAGTVKIMSWDGNTASTGDGGGAGGNGFSVPMRRGGMVMGETLPDLGDIVIGMCV